MSQEPDATKAVKLLERDLQNAPYHCFGHHDGCSPDFCTAAKERVEASSSNTSIDGASDDGEDDHPENSDDLTGKFSKPLACLPHSIHANTPHRFEFDWV